MFQQMQAMAQKQLDEFRMEIQRRDQEILAMSAKMKTLEEQHQDYQRHIAVLKESLCAKEEHYNMLQGDVEELRQRLEEKNRLIEKKTQQAQQERSRGTAELTEMREHMDIKDRKINVLQRKFDLLEATKKQQNVPAQNATEDFSVQKKQIEEQRKHIEEQRKHIEEQSRRVDEQRKTVENKHKHVDEKEKQLAELDKQLKKRKEQMDQLEASLQKAGGNVAVAGELNKKLVEAEKKLEKAQEESQRSATEMERLLQLVQMSQEEQNTKERQIVELQQALRNAQAKLKSQQAAAQKEENATANSECDELLQKGDIECTGNTEREDYIRDLEKTVTSYENLLRDNRYEIQELETALELKNKKLLDMENIHNLQLVEAKFEERRGELIQLENRLVSDNESIVCAEEINNLRKCLSTKESRVNELEHALRESIKIATERERVLHQEEVKRKQIIEKVSKLEQRLLSLQSAQAMRCHTCKPFIARMNSLELRLSQLVTERKDHLQELAHMKREALEAAISEKDAHLALLEMSGIRSVRQADEADRLRNDKRRLVERLKQEDELSVSLQEDSVDDLSFETVETFNGQQVT
uniref:ELKS/Rab6-interacting/CAST family member 1 n=2 Tax=Photinus pyralis TaxID=7054 RepID=A0A1Y1LD43_PHOPY